jgi:hypothetical protein
MTHLRNVPAPEEASAALSIDDRGADVLMDPDPASLLLNILLRLAKIIRVTESYG